MKLHEFRNIIKEELLNALQELAPSSVEHDDSLDESWESFKKHIDEHTVSSHEPVRKMTPDQIKARERIGKAMLADPRTVKRYKAMHKGKDHPGDWKCNLWATASSLAIGGRGAGKKKPTGGKGGTPTKPSTPTKPKYTGSIKPRGSRTETPAQKMYRLKKEKEAQAKAKPSTPTSAPKKVTPPAKKTAPTSATKKVTPPAKKTAPVSAPKRRLKMMIPRKKSK